MTHPPTARDVVLGRIRDALVDAPAAVVIPRDYEMALAPGIDVVELFVERVSDYRATVHRATDATLGAVIDDVLVARRATRLAVLTGCAVAIAETGTIVLDGGSGQGRRALSLLPDLHVCVVRSDQVVGTVPEALARLDPTRPQTWISGPSATSDIELQRVEGVHGPRRLDVVIVDHVPAS